MHVELHAGLHLEGREGWLCVFVGVGVEDFPARVFHSISIILRLNVV